MGNGGKLEKGLHHKCESHMLEYKNGEDWPWRGMGIQEADSQGCVLAIPFVLI